MAKKESVSLRQRELKDGSITLYLDIYRNGKRNYEYLRLYLVPEKSREAKQKNRETLAMAEAIRSKRVLEVLNDEYDFNQSRKDIKFYDFYLTLLEKKKGKLEGKEGRGNWGNWVSVLRHLEIYDKHFKELTMHDITNKWIKGFRKYLLDADAWSADYRKRIVDHKLSLLTAHHYFSKLMSALKDAIKEGLLQATILNGVEPIKEVESERNYLTIDELKTLAATPCDRPHIRRAFLFSCLTGLRRSDILNLQWHNVTKQGELTRIIFKQQKTSGQEYFDITPQADELMGERGKPNEYVFDGLYSAGATNRVLQDWCFKAGISKKITFHCARHTFAVMMLDLGTDIFTVSKLLGHRDLSTTQVYAKVLDKNKQKAVCMIPRI